MSKGEAAALLKEALQDKGIKELVIAQETHADGSPHLHAYVHLEKKYSARGSHTKLKLGDHYPNV